MDSFARSFGVTSGVMLAIAFGIGAIVLVCFLAFCGLCVFPMALGNSIITPVP